MDTNTRRVRINQSFANTVYAPEIPTFSSWWCAMALVTRQWERQSWGDYKHTIQLTKGMRANKAVSALEHHSKVGTCSSLMRSHLAPWAHPGLLSWWLSFLCPWAAHTKLCVPAGEHTCAKHLCQVLLMCLSGKKELSWGLCHVLLSSPSVWLLWFAQRSDLWCGKKITYVKGEK